MEKIVILTEGRSNPSDAKTACGMVRYRGREVVGLLDTTCAGKTAQDVFGVGGDIPVVATLDEVDADTLLVGIAPVGGSLPEPWRPVLREAIERGMKIISGLHLFIAEDPEFGPLAREKGVTIFDARRPPDDLTVSANIARDTPCFRVLTVGMDCNVGKMHTAIELAKGLKKAGRNAEFVATGQTGIMIYGTGVAVDRVVSDFVPGAIEGLILERQDREFLVVEGQGSLNHPLYACVTLGLLHGCAPQAMVMCYEAGRDKLRHIPVKLPRLEKMIPLYEELAGMVCPSRVVALSANTSALPEEEATRELRLQEDRLGIPATDPVRFGPEKLIDAILKAAGG